MTSCKSRIKIPLAGKQLQESIEASEAAWRNKIETVWTITGSTNHKGSEIVNEMKEISSSGSSADENSQTNKAFDSGCELD